MIIESIINLLLSPLLGLIDLLPPINFITLEDWEYLSDVLIQAFRGVGCLIPILDIMPIMVSIISLHAFRLVWAIVLRVKSFIPLFGG